MSQSRAIEDKRASGRTKVSVHENESKEHGPAEGHYRGQNAGQEFPNDQNLASHGHQGVIVQTLLHNFAAEEPGKQSHPREDDGAVQIELEDVSKDSSALLPGHIMIQQCMHSSDPYG